MNISPKHIVALAGCIFIAPFFFFSAMAGRISDRISKSRFIVWVKAAEIIIMALGALGFALGDLRLLLVVLFFMGLQSAFFGPAKYSIIPELVPRDELLKSNALIESGTFLAILLGTIVGGLVAASPTLHAVLGPMVIVVAVLGLMASFQIQRTEQCRGGSRTVLGTFALLRLLYMQRPLFFIALGISWFWFFGAVCLSVLPVYAADVLHVNAHVMTLFLALFCIGIGIGSWLCARLNQTYSKERLISLGAWGMSFCSLILYGLGAPLNMELRDLATFIADYHGASISCILMMMAMACGVYSVPLYTLLQERSERVVRSQAIAANNVLNALMMVIASGCLMAAYGLGFTVPQIFGVLAILNMFAWALFTRCDRCPDI